MAQHRNRKQYTITLLPSVVKKIQNKGHKLSTLTNLLLEKFVKDEIRL